MCAICPELNPRAVNSSSTASFRTLVPNVSVYSMKLTYGISIPLRKPTLAEFDDDLAFYMNSSSAGVTSLRLTLLKRLSMLME